MIRNNPFPFYRALREEQPVYYDPKLDLYLVTRFDDAMAVLRDDVNFSLEHGYQDRYANGFVDELAEIMDRDGGGFIRDIIACDPPQHRRLRRLIETAFTAHRVRDLEPRVRQIVIDLIEPLAAQGHGDGIKDIGGPLTAHIICEQLGFDFHEIGADRIARWSNALLAQIGRMQGREEMVANARDMCDLQNYIMPRIRERQAAPREDMMSDLVHARLDDDANPTLSFEEQVSCIRAFLIAGNDTTAAAIANVMLILATQPDLAEELAEAIGDDKLMARFVDEVLRLQPPTHGLFRTALNELSIGGTTVPAMSQVCIMFASANDDSAKFACPRALDLNRSNTASSLTFGAGIHRCVGSALARMEVKVATQEIVRRLKTIALAVPVEELTYLPTIATQTLERLPLTFSRRCS